ncbi:MAG: DUF721 domain-containing protein [Gemmatimonadales bacterium]
MTDRKRRPVPIGDAVSGFLAKHGLKKRVEQATVIDDWAAVVGGQISSVTRAVSITPDGTLFVAVKTHAWMTELTLMEPELVKALNAAKPRDKVRKIRYQLER